MILKKLEVDNGNDPIGNNPDRVLRDNPTGGLANAKLNC